MTAPLTGERLAEIRRSVAEVADYMADGLVPERKEYRDRADLLAEVERLRAELNGMRAREHALGEEVEGLRAALAASSGSPS